MLKGFWTCGSVMGVIEHKEGIRRCSKVQCHCSLSWKAISSCWLTEQHWGQGSCWIYPHTLGLQAAQEGDFQDLELQTVYLCCQLRIFVWVWMIKWDSTCEVFSIRSNTQKVLNTWCLLLLLWLLLLTPFIEPFVALLLLLNINNNSVHSFSHRPFLKNFIYLFIAVLGLRFCARAFSSCGERGPLFIAVRGPLTIAASLVAEHKLQRRRLSNCGSRA